MEGAYVERRKKDRGNQVSIEVNGNSILIIPHGLTEDEKALIRNKARAKGIDVDLVRYGVGQYVFSMPNKGMTEADTFVSYYLNPRFSNS